VEPKSNRFARFGVFEVDLDARELRKHGLRVKLQDQPFRVLAMLLAPGPSRNSPVEPPTSFADQSAIRV
jgi:hypothetical protein